MSEYYYGGLVRNNSYRDVLSILSVHDSINSVKTSSLPLAQFWGEKGLSTRIKMFTKYLKGIDLLNARKYFEFPTVVKKGIGKASMTDLMLITDNHRIALESKYTEYQKAKYEPVSSWNKGEETNKGKVLDGWLEYIGKGRKDIADIGSVPYQLIHRIASAYASDELSPVVIYQLFYDNETEVEKINGFVTTLKQGLVKLALEDLTFFAVKTEITTVPPDLGNRSSEYFLKMVHSSKSEREVYGPLTNTTPLLHKAAGSLRIEDIDYAKVAMV